jgi:SAM-dependent methyltransferase
MVVERKDGWASGEDYEPYVGRWSRLVAREFVGWLDVLPNRQWLDVGCGTGALSDVVLERLARPSNRYRSGWRLCFLCTPKSYRSARDLSGHAPAIAGVFTPPALRGRGYAAPVNAAAVERIFAEGKSASCLFTDLRNPASNRCDAEIGFEPASASWHYPRARAAG